MGRRKTSVYWIKSKDNTIRALLGKYRLTKNLKISGTGGLAEMLGLTYPYLCKVINGDLGTSLEIANQLVGLLRRKLGIRLALGDCFVKIEPEKPDVYYTFGKHIVVEHLVNESVQNAEQEARNELNQ